MSSQVVEIVAVAQGERPRPESARVDWLAARGWMSQDMQLRGSCLATRGLAAVGHPELVMLNVPLLFADEARRLLARLAQAVRDGIGLEQEPDLVLYAVDETEMPGLTGPAFRVLPL